MRLSSARNKPQTFHHFAAEGRPRMADYSRRRRRFCGVSFLASGCAIISLPWRAYSPTSARAIARDQPSIPSRRRLYHDGARK